MARAKYTPKRGDAVQYKTKLNGNVPVIGTVVSEPHQDIAGGPMVVRCYSIALRAISIVPVARLVMVEQRSGARAEAAIETCRYNYEQQLRGYPAWMKNFIESPGLEQFLLDEDPWASWRAARGVI